MELAEAKERLKAIEGTLADSPFVEFHAFEREGRTLHLAVTDRLRKKARKEGVWRSRELLATLKNAAYGYDEQKARSVGGRDGIFLMDRTFHPANEMMRKLFDRFIDKSSSGVEEVALALDTPLDELLPVRLVSHHMRLLGVLAHGEEADWLVLVDCDRSE
jgi:Magnesium chelatase, subunit ChlI